MESRPHAAHTAFTDNDDTNDLYDLAVEMALEAFNSASEEHVGAILERLDFNERHGHGLVGVVTVH